MHNNSTKMSFFWSIDANVRFLVYVQSSVYVGIGGMANALIRSVSGVIWRKGRRPKKSFPVCFKGNIKLKPSFVETECCQFKFKSYLKIFNFIIK